jgi:hypothetical protein
MPWEAFEPMITVSEWAKTVHALNHSATVTGENTYYLRYHVFYDGEKILKVKNINFVKIILIIDQILKPS